MTIAGSPARIDKKWERIPKDMPNALQPCFSLYPFINLDTFGNLWSSWISNRERRRWNAFESDKIKGSEEYFLDSLMYVAVALSYRSSQDLMSADEFFSMSLLEFERGEAQLLLEIENTPTSPNLVLKSAVVCLMVKSQANFVPSLH